jgi:hypothetical protein
MVYSSLSRYFNICENKKLSSSLHHSHLSPLSWMTPHLGIFLKNLSFEDSKLVHNISCYDTNFTSTRQYWLNWIWKKGYKILKKIKGSLWPDLKIYFFKERDLWRYFIQKNVIMLSDIEPRTFILLLKFCKNSSIEYWVSRYAFLNIF